uniref:outer membrane beta-barrel protein n=1 Tax=uncultured Draconibacterium sp. TaxID=1573823 RepID=UPI003216FE87
MCKTKLTLIILFIISTGFSYLTAQTKQTNLEMVNATQTGNWRIALSGGLGYLTGSTSDEKEALIQQGFASADIDSYIKQLKTGSQFSGQVHYMFWPNLGLGIDYNFYTSSGNLAGYVDPGDMATYVYAEVEEKVITNYAGLSLFSQSWLKSDKIRFYSQVSFGLTMYREELIFAYSPLLFTGKAFGGNAELGVEYFIHRNIALGANFTLFQSTITKIDMDNGSSTQEVKLEDEQRLSLTRLNTGIGLRFYF